MYTTNGALLPAGYVLVTVNNTQSNAVELASAWGMMARPKLGEDVKKGDGFFVYKMRKKTYKQWRTIVEAMKGVQH